MSLGIDPQRRLWNPGLFLCLCFVSTSGQNYEGGERDSSETGEEAVCENELIQIS